jgi:glutathione synthase/RimK-type ligase-like ATP-grasp enzyme
VIETALNATNLIGDGFYGVDLKQVNGKPCVIEINDNPNVDAGNEDQELKADLYRRIMDIFLSRIERRKSAVDSN